MKLQTYNDMTITVMSKTKEATHSMKLACDITQKREVNFCDALSPKLAKFLIDAEHTSVFEHASMTFLARGISRSLLAQVTRQRHFSFTSASQHYQDYRDYPMSIRPGSDNLEIVYEQALAMALSHYINLVKLGEKPEEARQVLPNACTVNLVITANPRALLEFIQVRCCKRNTQEMQIFAHKLLKVCQLWIPEIFNQAGPACLKGKCNQGAMSCGKPCEE